MMFRCFILGTFGAACALGQTPNTAPGGLSIDRAVQMTLTLNPLLHIQEKQVDINRGIKQQETGRFDIVLDASGDHNRVNTPLSPAEALQAQQAGISATTQNSNISDLNGSASRLYRNGIAVSPTFSMTRNTDNLLNFDGLNTAHGGLQVVLPLLRNRGREVVGARETAAGINIEASLLDVTQTAAALINNTVQTYWQVVAARAGLEVAHLSEDRGRTLLENVQYLIQNDRLPRSELNDVTANLADRITSRISAEQQVVQAQQALAIALGLTYAQVSTLEMPSDPMPEPNFAELPSTTTASIDYYVSEALKRRSDYLAALKREKSASVIEVAAKNQLRPQLDVTLGTGWSGLHAGTTPDKWLWSPVTNVGGIDATVSLHYNFAPRNNAAVGQLVQAEGSVDQARLQSADAARNIASSVVVAATALRSGILRLQQARATVAAFQKALDGERDKLRLGVGSLVDVLTIEDRLTGAQGSEVSALLNYAVSLAQFRYSTGTFVDPVSTTQSLNRDLYYQAPFQGAHP